MTKPPFEPLSSGQQIDWKERWHENQGNVLLAFTGLVGLGGLLTMMILGTGGPPEPTGPRLPNDYVRQIDPAVDLDWFDPLLMLPTTASVGRGPLSVLPGSDNAVPTARQARAGVEPRDRSIRRPLVQPSNPAADRPVDPSDESTSPDALRSLSVSRSPSASQRPSGSPQPPPYVAAPVTRTDDLDSDPSGVNDSSARMSTNASVMHIAVFGAQSDAGVMRLAIYGDVETFNDPARALFKQAMRIEKGSAYCDVPRELLPLKFAVAAYHDANDNGQLDTNFLRIPSEAYGYTNRVRGVLGPPIFEDAVIDRPAPGLELRLVIR